jgi:hypothetical protein
MSTTPKTYSYKNACLVSNHDYKKVLEEDVTYTFGENVFHSTSNEKSEFKFADYTIGVKYTLYYGKERQDTIEGIFCQKQIDGIFYYIRLDCSDKTKYPCGEYTIKMKLQNKNNSEQIIEFYGWYNFITDTYTRPINKNESLTYSYTEYAEVTN